MTILDDRYLELKRRLGRADWTADVDGADLETALVRMARLAGSIAPELVLDTSTDVWRDGLK